MSALISFLSGSFFRLIWAQAAGYFDKKQEHEHEIVRMRLQDELEASQHLRDLERLRVQGELGVKEVMVRADADIAREESQAFVEAMRRTGTPTGIPVVDAWNGSIRPLVATISVILWVLSLNSAGWQMSEWDKELVGVALGFFFASRALVKDKK